MDDTFDFILQNVYENLLEDEQLGLVKQVYELINSENLDSLEIFFNKFLILTNENVKDNIFITPKDEVSFRNMYTIMIIIKKLNDLKEFDIVDVQLLLNLYYYKDIKSDLYDDIMYFRKQLKLINKSDDISFLVKVYKELWHKFLNPKDRYIIKRKYDYYIDINDQQILKDTISLIINDYIKLITSQLKKSSFEDYNIQNLNIQIVFFMLVNNMY